MVKKHSKESKKKETKKSVDFEKFIIGGLIVCLILLIGYAIVNLDKVMPDQGGDSGTVLATVNNEPIYQEDIDSTMKYLQSYDPSITEETVLNQTINQMLLLQEANNQGLSVSDEEVMAYVDGYFAELLQQVSEEQLVQILAEQNLTLEQFRNDTIDMYREQTLMQMLINNTVLADFDESKFAAVEVTDEDIRAFYDENKDMMVSINASHILICYAGATNCQANRTKEEAMALAEDVLDELKQTGDFEALAMEYSDGPTGVNGGNLGFFGKGQMVKEFEDAAFALKPNQISDIIETQFGYHIIKLNDKRDEFDDFRTEISFQLQYQNQMESQAEMQAAQQKAVSEYIMGLREDAEIRYFTANPALKNQVTSTPGIQTFNMKEGEACTEDGKPIIRMFSTTSCPHCKWIKETYDSTMKELVSEGKIVAYHWELDTGDDTLTQFTEEFVPETEIAIFREFNQRSSVPTFVFGCKYYRIGNGYEAEGDLNLEKAEFLRIIDELSNS